MEKIIIKLDKQTFEKLVDNGCLKFNEFEVKEVKIIDDFFNNDQLHSELTKDSIKAYKKLKDYEFKKRNGI